jgi:phosphate acetyltransferase
VFVAPLLGAVFAGADAQLQSGDSALLDSPVLGTVVAGMSLEHVLDRLIEGAVVVVPADRPEVLVGTLAAHLSATFPSLAGIVLNGPFPLADSIRRVIDGLGTDLPIATTDLGTFASATRINAVRSSLAADSPAKYQRARAMFDDNVDAGEILRLVRALPPAALTPERFEHSLWDRARDRPTTIVLAEGDDDRILRAAAIVSARRIADLVVLGDEEAMRARAAELHLDLGDIRIVSPNDPELVERFAREYVELRKHKGVTFEQAAETMRDVSYFATMMVHLGLAGGMVSGARHSTAHTIRPAFEIVKTAPGFSLVSSVFFMALADRVLVYGDCAIVPQPGSTELADIAIASAATAEMFGIAPRVAMLSYSTGDSGTGADVEAVRHATGLVRERRPDLPVAGPIQYDAAIDPVVGASKMPDSDVAGHATVFIFPDLNTGNNTYKAVQRSANALAIGPILQGLAKPVNDLSRGALVRDIVNTIAITAVQAAGMRNE